VVHHADEHGSIVHTQWNVDFLIDYLRMCQNDDQARERLGAFLERSGAMAYVDATNEAYA
jgi:hypothetical protein